MKFLSVLFVLGTISAVFGQSCTDANELENCVYKSAFMMNREAKLPTNVAEMKTHCSNAHDSLNCLMTFNEKCVTGPPNVSLKRIYSTVQRGLNDRCSNDEKLQEFVDHLKCLHEDDSKMELVRRCSDRHIKHLEQIIDVPTAQRTGPVCCAFKYFYKCVKDVVNEQCGDDVAEYFENLLNEYKDELLMQMCDAYDTMDKCAAKLPAPVWGPMKAIIDQTEKIQHNYRTTIPVIIRLLDQFLKKD